ncbi:MAG: hypothetical protein FJ029_01300 [Actinobacteria bacterium]|nr:hypothetical protein [Actinomycetota bacterium]
MTEKIVPRLGRRRLVLAALAFGAAASPAVACGPDEAAAPTSASAAQPAATTPAKPADNLATGLPALPEMRSGRSERFQEFTATGRLDRVVYFSEVPAGHVLNFYLDEMTAQGWVESTRTELTARGGTLEYDHPKSGQHLKVIVSALRESAASTTLELSTPSPGSRA